MVIFCFCEGHLFQAVVKKVSPNFRSARCENSSWGWRVRREILLGDEHVSWSNKHVNDCDEESSCTVAQRDRVVTCQTLYILGPRT